MRHPGHLYLTGYRGSGKTSVARQLALNLGLEAIDLDDRIEAAAGKPIQAIFAEEGEAGFRDREQSALQIVVEDSLAIIALGGGAILREANRQTIGQTGRCVWLDASPQALAERIETDHTSRQRRPRLTSLDAVAEVQRLIQEREPLYRQVSDLRIDTTGRSIEEIAEQVLEWLDAEMEAP